MPHKKTVVRIHPPYNGFKAWLAENGIKLKEVAEVLGTTVATISQKNNGFSDYTGRELNRLADHFGLDLNIFKPKKVS